MKRISLLALVLLALPAASVATASPAQHGARPKHLVKTSSLTPGFFRGRAVRYFDFGPIKLAPGNKLAPIWVVTNPADGQHNIIDTVPGQKSYSPLWAVVKVTWKDGATARVLRSAAAVKAAEKAGEVSLQKTNLVVNCPVVGFGQKEVAGFAKGRTIAYLDLGPVKLRPGNKVAPIWAVTNGVDAQHNIIDTLPGDKEYTPLWKVNMVTFADGVTPRLLESAAEVQAALKAGDVTIERTSIVVNCPVL